MYLDDGFWPMKRPQSGNVWDMDATYPPPAKPLRVRGCEAHCAHVLSVSKSGGSSSTTTMCRGSSAAFASAVTNTPRGIDRVRHPGPSSMGE
jgi:hypothetical protein